MKSEVTFDWENAAWPTLLVTAGGEILTANAAAKHLFGPALNGNPASLTAIWPGDSGVTAGDFFRGWEQAPVPTSLLKFNPPGGAATIFSTAICPLPHDGKKCFLLQLLPSATGAEVAAVTKPGATDAALKQKLDCVLQLARTVSLDFNNALTGVLAHTSLLLGKAEPEHPWRRSLLEVEKSAARAAEIASELALFSRQEKETRRVPVGNLNLVADRCAEFFKSAHGQRFNWKMTLERAIYAARFDEAKLQQALTKIFENAVEAFPANANGQIAVETRNVELTQATQDLNVRLAAGNYVCVEISDNGTGIEADALPRIFEPFFTTKRPPHRGLGLALVYGIVTNHGGGVAISSQPGKGTSARVYLPAENSLVREAVGASQGFRGTGTILVVDDEGLLLTMAETILSDFGFKVLTANNGAKALAVLAQVDTPVDLVITDLVMPGMGGRELIERIRELDPDLPVICTSGYVMPEDQNKTGAGYLQKPFTSTELLLKVKAALPATSAVD